MHLIVNYIYIYSYNPCTLLYICTALLVSGNPNFDGGKYIDKLLYKRDITFDAGNASSPIGYVGYNDSKKHANLIFALNVNDVRPALGLNENHIILDEKGIAFSRKALKYITCNALYFKDHDAFKNYKRIRDEGIYIFKCK